MTEIKFNDELLIFAKPEDAQEAENLLLLDDKKPIIKFVGYILLSLGLSMFATHCGLFYIMKMIL